MRPLKIVSLLFVVSLASFLPHCPRDEEDAIMFQLYHRWNDEITRSVLGTDIDPAYLAALISLESSPPGNKNSARFEREVYERLTELKVSGRPFGGIPRDYVLHKSDGMIRELSTSYGLTQIMGFHCQKLGCSIQDLKSEYHLQWAVAYMQINYGRNAKKQDWQACFRIHNTGHPQGITSRKDYVERGLKRMSYYRGWILKKGSIFK